MSEKLPETTIKLVRILSKELEKMDAELPHKNPNYQPGAERLSNLKSTYTKANRERKIQENKIITFNKQSNAK